MARDRYDESAADLQKYQEQAGKAKQANEDLKNSAKEAEEAFKKLGEAVAQAGPQLEGLNITISMKDDGGISKNLIGMLGLAFDGVSAAGGVLFEDMIKNIVSGKSVDVIEETKKIFNNLDKGLKGSMEESLGPLKDSFGKKFSSSFSGAKENLSKLFDGMKSKVSEGFPKIRDSITTFSSNMWSGFKKTSSEALSTAGKVFSDLKTGVATKLGEAMTTAGSTLSAWGTTISTNFGNMVNTIGSTASTIGSKIASGISGAATTAGSMLSTLGTTISTGFATAMSTAGSVMSGAMAGIGSAMSSALAFITSPMGLVIIGIMALIAAGVLIYQNWSEISAFLIGVWQDIQTAVEPVITYLTGLITAFIENMSTFLAPVIESFQTILQRLIDFIDDVFAGNWEDVWDNIVSIVSNVFEGVKNTIKNILNRIIDIINSFISAINSLRIPDWVPGMGGLSINIPVIPYLASGGLAFGDTLAIVGDNPNARIDPEVIAPLSKLEGMLSAEAAAFPAPSQEDSFNRLAATVANAVTASLSSANLNASIQSSDLKIDGTALGRVVFNLIKKEADVQGYQFFSPKGVIV